ncbi:MAG: DUF502 domain-containing protein [Proteobacteria bacterium]|nr:DUF502 domain-containing protein [Pseudomonadota bacterium]
MKDRSRLQAMFKIIKDHFLSGLLVLAPILIVAFVFQWIFGGIMAWMDDGPLSLFPTDPAGHVAGAIRLLLAVGVLLSGVIVVSLIGFLSRLYFGKKVLEWLKELIERIPFFGAIYSSLNQLFAAVSPGEGKEKFNRVVFVEYPRKGVWAVAFVTGHATLRGIPPGFISVFIPTVPNPTSGFHLMVSETEVVESGLSVENAFKLILSLGVAVPQGGVAVPHE